MTCLQESSPARVPTSKELVHTTALPDSSGCSMDRSDQQQPGDMGQNASRDDAMQSEGLPDIQPAQDVQPGGVQQDAAGVQSKGVQDGNGSQEQLRQSDDADSLEGGQPQALSEWDSLQDSLQGDTPATVQQPHYEPLQDPQHSPPLAQQPEVQEDDPQHSPQDKQHHQQDQQPASSEQEQQEQLQDPEQSPGSQQQEQQQDHAAPSQQEQQQQVDQQQQQDSPSSSQEEPDQQHGPQHTHLQDHSAIPQYNQQQDQQQEDECDAAEERLGEQHTQHTLQQDVLQFSGEGIRQLEAVDMQEQQDEEPQQQDDPQLQLQQQQQEAASPAHSADASQDAAAAAAGVDMLPAAADSDMEDAAAAVDGAADADTAVAAAAADDAADADTADAAAAADVEMADAGLAEAVRQEAVQQEEYLLSQPSGGSAMQELGSQQQYSEQQIDLQYSEQESEQQESSEQEAEQLELGDDHDESHHASEAEEQHEESSGAAQPEPELHSSQHEQEQQQQQQQQSQRRVRTPIPAPPTAPPDPADTIPIRLSPRDGDASRQQQRARIPYPSSKDAAAADERRDPPSDRRDAAGDRREAAGDSRDPRDRRDDPDVRAGSSSRVDRSRVLDGAEAVAGRAGASALRPVSGSRSDRRDSRASDGREPNRESGRDAGRAANGRESHRESGRTAAGRDSGRESDRAAGGRESGRESGREVGRAGGRDSGRAADSRELNREPSRATDGRAADARAADGRDGRAADGRDGRAADSRDGRQGSAARASGRNASPSRGRASERPPERKDSKSSARDSKEPSKHTSDRDAGRDPPKGSSKVLSSSARDSHRDPNREPREQPREREQPPRDRRAASRDAKDRGRGGSSVREPERERERAGGSGREPERAQERGSGREPERERERERERQREREPDRAPEREKVHAKDRGRDRDSRGRHASPPRQETAPSSSKGKAAAAAAPAAAAAAPAAPGAFAVLDKFLAKQNFVEEVLLPTPMNVNTIHVAGEELLNFIEVQQWAEEKLGTSQPLLNGAFVLVQSRDVPELSSREVMDACGYGARSSSNANRFAQAVDEKIPLRLRQIHRVEYAPGEAAKDAYVLLEGGGRVRAGKVSSDTLGEVTDYEYVCCELAELQEMKLLKALRVYDIAHVAWRMRVCGDLENAIEKFNKEQAELKEAGYDAEVVAEARRVALDEIRSTMAKLPPMSWVDPNILQYIEMNPFARAEFPDEAREPLNRDQSASLTRFASDAWRSYVKNKLTGVQPRPITEYVPWKKLPQEEEDAAGATAALPGVQQQGAPAGQYAAGVAVPPTPYPDMSAYGAFQQGMAGMQNPQQQIPGMQFQQQQPVGYGAAASAVGAGGMLGGAVGGLAGGVYGGALLGGGGSLQQRGTGLLDIDDEDDLSFFDDPLAPMDNSGMMAGSGGLGGGLGAAGAAAAAAAPRGLGVGMSLDGPTTGLNLLQHAAGGSGNPYGAADAGGADYNYWVARGNVEAAATDPRRARAAAAAAGRGAGLTGALGPMWGGQKPPPGMDNIGLGSRQQQQRDHGERDMRDNGPPSGRVSALDRLHSPPGEPPNRGAGRDRSPDRGPRQKSSPFNMDMRPLRERPGYSSRSPPRRRSEDSRRRSSPGGRGPAAARLASRSPPRGPSRNRSRSPPPGTRGAGERDRRGRGASPPPGRAAAAAAAAPGGRSNSRQGRSASPVRGRDTRGRDLRDARDPRDARDARGPRDASPADDNNNNKRRRDASTGRRGEPDSPVGRQKRSRWGPEQQDTRSAPPRDSKRAGDADAGRAGGQFPGPPAGGDLEAVARRFDGRLEGAEGIFGELQLEKDVKSWLRELAEYAGRPPRPLEQPTPIKLGTLAKQLPLPHNVLSRYQTMTRFVTERPEISFANNDKHYIILVPVHHAELLSARSTAPSPSQQKPRPAAAAAGGGGGDGSDPEDYLAGQRGSKRRGSAGRREDSPGRERDRDRDRDSERGKERRTQGSEGPRGGDRREQPPVWQEDRQRYEGRDSRSAADRAASSPPRRGAGAAADGAGPSPSFPGAPRSQERANRYSVGSAKTGSGRDPVGAPPPVLDPRTATDALWDYGKFLEEDLRGPGKLHEEGAYKILPLPLADRVKPGSKLTLNKLLEDFYPEFELRSERPGGPQYVMRHPNPNRAMNRRTCRFWNPLKLSGCQKGAGCDFKHELVPAPEHFNA